MPRVSQIIVRTALINFALGYTLGALALIEKGLRVLPWLWTLKASHVHVLLIGAMVQLACGVAVWIMPRLDTAGDRGNLLLVWIGYAALNGGVALAALHAPLTALVGSSSLDAMPILAAALYGVAAAAFVAHIWRRVLPFQTIPRPSQPSEPR